MDTSKTAFISDIEAVNSHRWTEPLPFRPFLLGPEPLFLMHCAAELRCPDPRGLSTLVAEVDTLAAVLLWHCAYLGHVQLPDDLLAGHTGHTAGTAGWVSFFRCMLRHAPTWLDCPS